MSERCDVQDVNLQVPLNTGGASWSVAFGGHLARGELDQTRELDGELASALMEAQESELRMYRGMNEHQ